uniref:Uncharacterized protein n=2 Tax=unclassified Caudoviricetes TaxID=2788787 RepID=A0A8S5Q872_9CAUD|nr:MAG TPA: hypothetical protein [Siphoviridae sp. ctAvK3]DAE15130.1 MAG TPA: hypothetical protein [Siphoviridae sp. ctdVv30]
MAEIKYYAAQVAPEDQDPNFDRCNWWGWTVTGNRDYEGFTTAEYNKLFGTNGNVGALDLMVEEYQIMVENVNNSEYNTLEELLQGELGDYNRDWTPEQLEQWKEILSQDVPRWENMKCKALSLLCNREYAYKAIHGVCQSDWQRCYYPKDEENLLGDLEMQYFNTGEEWEVCDAAEIEEQGLPAPANGNEVDDLIEVSTSYYIGGSYSRENLAKALGCKPDEIKMWRWKGYRKISEYEEDR